MSKPERMDPAESARARQDPDTIVVNAPVGAVGPDPRVGAGTAWLTWLGYTIRVDVVTNQRAVIIRPRLDMSAHEMGGRIPIPKRPWFKKRAAPGTSPRAASLPTNQSKQSEPRRDHDRDP